ncbi:hypothetical protein Amac_078150 [Acrocarpospora macrocephala]|uniref:Uncharacterized protein n=1 Tax=Acrocarpospora macrocephala TaxID=150177 RepID=A0A5M3X7Q3_9ACTN|nr:hypothetical protein Amac_078150 [Acrocarpospora macrocephala]
MGDLADGRTERGLVERGFAELFEGQFAHPGLVLRGPDGDALEAREINASRFLQETPDQLR